MSSVIHKEFFWSEASANKAAARIQRKGYKTRVTYSMRGDGSHDWLLTVLAP